MLPKLADLPKLIFGDKSDSYFTKLKYALNKLGLFSSLIYDSKDSCFRTVKEPD